MFKFGQTYDYDFSIPFMKNFLLNFQTFKKKTNFINIDRKEKTKKYAYKKHKKDNYF